MLDDDDDDDDDDLGLDSIADRTKTPLSVGSTRTFLEWDLVMFDASFNSSGVFEIKANFALLQAQLLDAAMLASYDVRSNRRGGMATLELTDWAGDELLYSRGEAYMGNASSTMRWKGDEVMSAAVSGSDAPSPARVEGAMTIWGGLYNVSSAVEYKDNMEYMQMTGAINDMSILASYDLMSKWRGGSMAMELVDWDGDEVLVMDGEMRSTKNASGLVSWKGRKVISFSRSLDELTDSLEDAMASSSYINFDDFFFGDDDIPDQCTLLDKEFADFDLKEYTRASWYVQQQQINPYQRRRDLFCVVATYDPDQRYSSSLYVPPDNFNPIGVYNYANEDEVNGDSRTPSALCGRKTNRKGRLLVSPCYLTNDFAG